jgi:VanZ family protein
MSNLTELSRPRPMFAGLGASFACIVLLAVLSWLPAAEMVRTGIGGHLEHATAYVLTAIIMGLASRGAPRLFVQSLLLVTLAAILEVGQLVVPGRTMALLDFAASSTGAAVGGLLMWTVRVCILSHLGLDRESDGDRPDPTCERRASTD